MDYKEVARELANERDYYRNAYENKCTQVQKLLAYILELEQKLLDNKVSK